MSVISALRWAKAFPRLLWGSGLFDAVDTKLFYLLVHGWFASIPVYDEVRTAVHPPATYLILWPFFGWMEMIAARWLWAATVVAALAWLGYLIVRESGASTVLERAFVALLLLSMHATAHTIRNGQLAVHLLPMLLAGLLLLQREQHGWGRDLLSVFLVLLALVKPSVSVPFFWIMVFLPGRLRPAVLVVLGYVALTFFAASFQESGIVTLLRQWMGRASAEAANAGYANLHILLADMGLQKWMLSVSLVVLAGLGLWIYRYRRVDFWLLLAVSAIVARFWTYHREYDDLLLLFPEVALFRLAKRGPSAGGSDVTAGALLAVTAFGMLLPVGLILRSSPWSLLLTIGNAVVWIALLVFLMREAGREKYLRSHITRHSGSSIPQASLL
jgi:hypothetical protein